MRNSKFLKRLDKRGQVTIFIIVGIVIVVGILILFYLFRGPSILSPQITPPRDFIQNCMDESVRDSLDRVYRNGGEADISFGVKYQGEDYNYLCYNAEDYLSCYNLHPLLEDQIESEIEDATKDDLQECFDKLRADLEAKRFEVSGGATSYSIDLLPGSVEINIEKEVIISGRNSTQSFNEFNFRVVDPIYDLVKVARRIVNDEATNCRFDRSEYMLFYPDYEIVMASYDNNKFYTITDRTSGKEFKFAVRTCAIPAGI